VIASRPAASFVWFLLFVSFAGCAHLSPPASLPSECPPASMLVGSLRASAPPALKGIAKIKVASPKETFSVKELIVAQKPNLLRLETLSPLGQPGFYAATDGQDLFIFDPSENTFYRGGATRRNLALIIPLKMDVEEMVSILRGDVSLIDYNHDGLHCTVREGGYAVRLEGRDQSTTQVLTFSQKDLKVVASEIYESHSLTCAVNYADYEMAENTHFPREITVSLPSEQTTVRINYKKLEFLPEVDSALFRLSAPQGARIIPLE